MKLDVQAMLTEQLPALRWLVCINENGQRFLRAAMDSGIAAEKLAVRLVDDALPRNTVEVYHRLNKHPESWRRHGYAAMLGDGSAEFTRESA